MRWILWILFAAAYALAVFYGFTLIANLIAAPFNAMLAARVEEKLTGALPADSDESLLRAIVPAVAGERQDFLFSSAGRCRCSSCSSCRESISWRRSVG